MLVGDLVHLCATLEELVDGRLHTGVKTQLPLSLLSEHDASLVDEVASLDAVGVQTDGVPVPQNVVDLVDVHAVVFVGYYLQMTE